MNKSSTSIKKALRKQTISCDTSSSLVSLINSKLSTIQSIDLGSIDVIISKNESQKILFIFNKGLPKGYSVGKWFLDHFSNDQKLFTQCSNADIKAFVFWDGLTSERRTIHIEDMQYLMRA